MPAHTGIVDTFSHSGIHYINTSSDVITETGQKQFNDRRIFIFIANTNGTPATFQMSKHHTIKPCVPKDVFPIVLAVYNGDSPSPDRPAVGLRSGELYLGPSDIWIVQSGVWANWKPSVSLMLDIDNDELYISPCATGGIQFVVDQATHEDNLPLTRLALGLQDSDDMTAVIAERIRAASAINTGSIPQDAAVTRTTHANTKSDIVMDVRVRKATLKGSKKDANATAAQRSRVNEATTSKEYVSKRVDKGKRKQEPERDLDATAANLQGDRLRASGPRDAKRRRTTPIMESLLTEISCPPDTPVVEWPNLGVNTYAPWFCDLDLEAVKTISLAPRAQDQTHGPGRPMVVELLYEAGNTWALVGLTSKIEEALSKGCAVLVRGWEPNPPLDFSVEAIQMYRPTMSQTVMVQNAVKRGKESSKGSKGNTAAIHESLTLDNFITLAADPNKCMNLLDLPNIQPDIPIFVRPLSDNVNARSATMNVAHLSKTGINSGKSYFGVQTMLGDAERVRGWDLMTHGGFLTHAHHDACGLCTFTSVRSGSKIWVYLGTPGDSGVGRESLFKAWDALFLDALKMTLPDVPLGALVLRKGDTLIQPPGANHVVYTPQNGLTSGGHFLCYSTMHLTQLVQWYDCGKIPGQAEGQRDTISTNADHPSIKRYLTWMVLGLPVLAQQATRTFYRRSTLALIALVEREEHYITIGTTEMTPAMHKNDTMNQEIAGERKAAMRIVNKLKGGLKITDAAMELEKGDWWDPGPVCAIKGLLREFVP
ncbi:hypothetical protein L210DRAFT_3648501 [Boletus edulis BED1]|uniref:JmjC domain-containing protein n=1 Tax=Boletus edulis BED1 TaxID=1328754 RepID=A0AAD4BP54_BOLED|nr:hypothetical protein L210DRAFT_3648501 [Boletus edulis BED1]